MLPATAFPISESGLLPPLSLPAQPLLGAQGFSLKHGWQDFGFECYGLRIETTTATEVINGLHHLTNTYDGQSAEGVTASGMRVLVRTTMLNQENGGLTVSISLENTASQPHTLTGAAFGQFCSQARFLPGEGHVLGWALRYTHTGNLRTERYPFCAADYPYTRQLPVETRVLGDTEDQPFPALFLHNEVTKNGLVLAFASQRTAAPVFAFKRKALFRPDVFDSFELRWDFPQSRGYTLQPGDTLTLDTLYLQPTRGIGADLAFDGFLDHLSSENDFLGRATPLNDVALHCTWNYGVFSDQREATLLGTARFISENLPQIRYFLIDDGYLEHTSETSRVFLNRFYPDAAAAPVSAVSWPDGIRGFTDELRRLGLKPGLWWTPTVRLPCRLYDDHPDWFLRRKDGSLYLIGSDKAYLDYSHPEALAFLDRTLAHILGHWGIDACKIDFYSQNFETRDALLYRPDCSSLELRNVFFETVRRHLPPDGVIMSCIAMGMGNPFLGEFVDTFRCSMDISDGLWQDQINNCLWSLPALGWGGRRTFLLNTDSIGINPALPDNENFFRLTWCYITMGLIETGGRLEKLAPVHLASLQKILARCDRGYPCRCPDDRAYTGVPLPEILYVDFPSESPTGRSGIRQSIAFFNWTEQPRAISLDRSRLSHPAIVIATNFWTDECAEWHQPFVTITLPPRSASLFDVKW